VKKYGISVLACVVLLGGLAAALLLVKPKATEAPVATPEPIALITRNAADVARLEIARFDEKLFVLTASAAGQRWKLGNSDMPVVHDTVSTVAKVLCSAYADEKLEGTEPDLAGYGLNPPLVTHTITFADGTSEKIMLGGTTPAQTQRYLMIEGDPAVYLVRSGVSALFNVSLDNIVDKTMAAVDQSNILYVHMKARGEEAIEAVTSDLERVRELQGTEFQTSILEVTSPVSGREMYITYLQSRVIEPLMTVTLGKIVEPMSEEALTTYGFDDPTYKFLFEGSGYRYYLMIGDDANDTGTVAYAVYEGLPFIFEVDTEALKPIYNVSVFNLTQRFLSIINISLVKDMVITGQSPNDVYNLVMNHTFVPAVSPNMPDLDFLSPTVNGNAVQETAFRNYYALVIGLAYDAILPESDSFKPVGAPALTVQYNLLDGTSVVNKYYAYDANYYAVQREDGMTYLINRSYVNLIVPTIGDLLAGNMDKEY